MKSYLGEVRARLIDLRFATSGKLITFNKRRGDKVKKGELVASLDKKQLQAELERQLADYEKARAEFEIFNLEKGEPKDDITKYLKTEKQAALNISVKEVELAKAKLDSCDLFSPVEGVVVDDNDLVTGLYITPASNPITLIDQSSYYFRFLIKQEEIARFLESRKGEVVISGIKRKYKVETIPLFPSKNASLLVEVKFEDTSELIYALKGKIFFK